MINRTFLIVAGNRETGRVTHLGGGPGALEGLEDAGGVVVVLHLAVVREGRGGDLGDAERALLHLLLALLAARHALRVVDRVLVVSHDHLCRGSRSVLE